MQKFIQITNMPMAQLQKNQWEITSENPDVKALLEDGWRVLSVHPICNSVNAWVSVFVVLEK